MCRSNDGNNEGDSEISILPSFPCHLADRNASDTSKDSTTYLINCVSVSSPLLTHLELNLTLGLLRHSRVLESAGSPSAGLHVHAFVFSE